eukprot:2933778-Pleurochrysis_carterae.AAC.1
MHLANCLTKPVFPPHLHVLLHVGMVADPKCFSCVPRAVVLACQHSSGCLLDFTGIWLLVQLYNIADLLPGPTCTAPRLYRRRLSLWRRGRGGHVRADAAATAAVSRGSKSSIWQSTCIPI